jgi:NTP pyrophosphatase (non-canonical NTP hydrolase)
MKELFYELRTGNYYKEIFMVVRNKMGTNVYREAFDQKENWWQTDMATGTLIDRDESYEVLDAIRKLL